MLGRIWMLHASPGTNRKTGSNVTQGVRQMVAIDDSTWSFKNETTLLR